MVTAGAPEIFFLRNDRLICDQKLKLDVRSLEMHSKWYTSWLTSSNCHTDLIWLLKIWPSFENIWGLEINSESLFTVEKLFRNQNGSSEGGHLPENWNKNWQCDMWLHWNVSGIFMVTKLGWLYLEEILACYDNWSLSNSI